MLLVVVNREITFCHGFNKCRLFLIWMKTKIGGRAITKKLNIIPFLRSERRVFSYHKQFEQQFKVHNKHRATSDDDLLSTTDHDGELGSTDDLSATSSLRSQRLLHRQLSSDDPIMVWNPPLQPIGNISFNSALRSFYWTSNIVESNADITVVVKRHRSRRVEFSRLVFVNCMENTSLSSFKACKFVCIMLNRKSARVLFNWFLMVLSNYTVLWTVNVLYRKNI